MNEICIYESNEFNPRYTIAIPTFKRANFLIDAIESSLNQTYIKD